MSKYREAGHPIDENGGIIHEDIDPFIPTGICAYCTNHEQETLAPEERGNDDHL